MNPNPNGLIQVKGMNVAPLIARARANAAKDACPNISSGELDQLVRQHVNAEEWEYYDTQWVTARVMQGAAAAFNFADITSTMQFFDTRTLDQHGRFTTNMTDNSKMDSDFICLAFSFEPWCPSDASGGATHMSTASQFVETLVHASVFTLKFGDDKIKYGAPALAAPAGGGFWTGSRLRNVAVAADQDSADCQNGFPSPASLNFLREPIVFKKGQPFTFTMQIAAGKTSTQGPIGVINALTALAGDTTAMIRWRMIGVRGNELLKGVPTAR